MPRKVSKPDSEVIAEARAFTRARKAREKAEKLRAHQLKKLAAVRAGDMPKLRELMKVDPLRGKTKRETRRRCNGLDIFFGKQVSMTYVSEVTLDSGDFFFGADYFDGVHRWQT